MLKPHIGYPDIFPHLLPNTCIAHYRSSVRDHSHIITCGRQQTWHCKLHGTHGVVCDIIPCSMRVGPGLKIFDHSILCHPVYIQFKIVRVPENFFKRKTVGLFPFVKIIA